MSLVEKTATHYTPVTVELHRHFEGSVFLKRLLAIYDDHFGSHRYTRLPELDVTKETRDFMFQTIEEGLKERSLENFIKLLSTRWIRFLAVKIMLAFDPEIAKQKLAEFLKALISDVIIKAISPEGINGAEGGEGIDFLVLLICPFNMTIDGDLKAENLAKIVSANHLTPQEKETYQLWLGKPEEARKKSGVTFEEYVELISATRDEIVKKREFQHKDVAITLALRRDADFDFLTDPDKLEERALLLQKLYARKKFEFVDLCGDETKAKYGAKHAVPLFRLLKLLGVLTSWHFLELNSKKRGLTNENIEAIQELPSLTFFMNHVVRALDRFPSNTKLRKAILDQQSVITVNVSSNDKTQTVSKIESHPYIKGFSRPNQFLEQALLAFCTDDPTILSSDWETALQVEISMVMKAVRNSRGRKAQLISPNSFEELITHKINVIVNHIKTSIKESREQLKVKFPHLFLDQPASELARLKVLIPSQDEIL